MKQSRERQAGRPARDSSGIIQSARRLVQLLVSLSLSLPLLRIPGQKRSIPSGLTLMLYGPLMIWPNIITSMSVRPSVSLPTPGKRNQREDEIEGGQRISIAMGFFMAPSMKSPPPPNMADNFVYTFPFHHGHGRRMPDGCHKGKSICVWASFSILLISHSPLFDRERYGLCYGGGTCPAARIIIIRPRSRCFVFFPSQVMLAVYRGRGLAGSGAGVLHFVFVCPPSMAHAPIKLILPVSSVCVASSGEREKQRRRTIPYVIARPC